MNNWQPISTAPKDGTLIRLRSPKHGTVNALWEWDEVNQRWVTQIAGVMGWIRACWDEAAQQPSEWQAI